MEPQRAGVVLPQREQDDGCGHRHATEFQRQANHRRSLRDRTCRIHSGSRPTTTCLADGQRFLMLKPTEQAQAAPTQINVVLNWTEELKQRVPAGSKK